MENNYVDLLIVHAEGKEYVVEAPAWEANLGELVEFRVADNWTLLGTVLERTTCEKHSDTWSCIKKLARIHDAVAIYNAKWSADPIDA